MPFLMNNHSKKNRTKTFYKKCLLEKSPLDKCLPEKSPGKKLLHIMPFAKEFPWKMLLNKKPLERFLLGKCPQGTKPPRNISFYGKILLCKMPTRKKGLLKMPLQNKLSTHAKNPRRKLHPGKSALKNALLKE